MVANGRGAKLKTAIRLVVGLMLGGVAAWAIMAGGFSLLRGMWPEYALAEPEKAFTLAMLFARLGIFSALIAGAASVATIVARDGRAAWLAGGLILLLSLPPHLYYLWDDYPAWYHFVYLLSIVPIAAYSGRVVRQTLPGTFPTTSAA
jgi:hypothetical protein